MFEFEYLIKNYFKVFTHKKINLNENYFLSFDEKNILIEEITCDYFYIDYAQFFWKGKKYIFKGNIERKTKNQTISFITEIEKNWCKNIYLVPSNPTKNAISINEESSFTIIKPNKVMVQIS